MHLNANDVVPALKNNLTFSHTPRGLGTERLSLRDVDSGDELRLRGFECSLARMLDGHRTARDLLVAARELGIPLTPGDLDAFVTRLEDRHLITTGEVDPDEVHPFDKREVWDDKTRELYRIALREGRQGHLNSALMSLDVLLHQRPGHDEAAKLKEGIEELKSGPTEVPFDAVFADTEASWEPQPVEKVGRKWPNRTIAALVVGSLAVVALVAAFVPFPHTVTSAAVLSPAATAKITAPRAGVVAAVDVKVGQWVDEDAVLYRYDVSDEQARLAEAVAALDHANRAQYDHLPKTPEAKAARARYDATGAMLAAAQHDLEIQRGLESNDVGKAEDSLNYALTEISVARESLDAIVPPEDREALQAAKSEVQALELAVLESEVHAPMAGVITRLGVQPGSEISRGATLMQIDDNRQLKAVTKLSPRQSKGLRVGHSVLVLANGHAVNTTVARTSAGTIEMFVDNAKLELAPGEAEVQIRGNPVPLIR